MALSSLFLALILAVTLAVAQNPAAGLVRHFVSFRFAANVSEDMQEEVQQRYFALQKLCVNTTTGKPYIVSFDGGAPNSLEGKQQNMTQAYIVTFASIEARNYFVGRPYTYPYDPYHDAFKQFVGPLLYQPSGPEDCGVGVIVIDFTVLPI